MKITDLDRYRIEDDELHKQCIQCKDFWPCDSEFFFARTGTADGLDGSCKACYLERRFPNGRPSRKMEEAA